MQTFIRLLTGKVITIDFVNGTSTVYDLKRSVADREEYPDEFIERMMLTNSKGKTFENDYVLTRDEFGDMQFMLTISL